MYWGTLLILQQGTKNNNLIVTSSVTSQQSYSKVISTAGIGILFTFIISSQSCIHQGIYTQRLLSIQSTAVFNTFDSGIKQWRQKLAHLIMSATFGDLPSILAWATAMAYTTDWQILLVQRVESNKVVSLHQMTGY